MASPAMTTATMILVITVLIIQAETMPTSTKATITTTAMFLAVSSETAVMAANPTPIVGP